MNIDASEELDKNLNGDEELQEKIRRHIYDDWLVVTILSIVEQQFDTTSFHCFRLYYILPKMTYDKLRAITKVKDCKKRVVTVKTWLQNNLDKKLLDKEFNKFYDNN